MRKLFLIFISLIISYNLYTIDLEPAEVLTVVQRISDRVNALSELNKDTTLQELILDLRYFVERFKYKEEKLKQTDKTLLTEKMTQIEDRIKKLRFLNLDDELFLIITYYKKVLNKLDEKEILANELLKTDSLSNEMLETKTEDLDKNLKDLFQYLIKAFDDLENKIDNLKGNKPNELDDVNKDMEKNRKKMQELENQIVKMNKSNVDESVIALIKELKNQEAMMREQLEKIIKEREQEKKILASAINAKQWGKEFAFQINLGLSGIYTGVSTGMIFPRIMNLFTIGLFFNLNIATPGTYIAEHYRTAFLSGSLYLSFATPVFINFIRVYLGGDFLFGAILSLVTKDLFGNNFTFGVIGFGGIEFYLIKQLAFFIEAGAGIIYTFGDMLLPQIRENNNNGTGIYLNFGARIFIANSDNAKKKILVD